MEIAIRAREEKRALKCNAICRSNMESILNKYTSLNLVGNNISDIDEISELVNLEDLNLSNNLIVDVMPLSKLYNLEIFVIADNFIEDITANENDEKLAWQDEIKEEKNINKTKPIKISFQIGDNIMWVDGKKYKIDKVIEENGRTLLPIRYIVETLGGSIDWHSPSKRVASYLDNSEVSVWIGQNRGKVNAVIYCIKTGCKW